MQKFLLEHRRYLFIAGAVFAADLITKLLAYFFLPFNEEVSIAGRKLYLYLTYNFEATGGQAEYVLGEVSKANAKLVLSAVAGMILGGYILLSQKLTLQPKWKVVIGVAVYAALSLVIETTHQAFEGVFSKHFTSWFTKAGAVFLYGSIFLVLQNKVLKALLAVIIGCGLGNLVNHFYPPYHVIDFLYWDLLYQWLKMGIFNLADVLINAAELMTGAYLLYWLGRKIIVRFTQPKIKVGTGA
ncbi:MAG: signal peptidase II [Cytophagales bacterium]|nr:signal peptidase II [Cytophagales bacterium]